DKTKERMGNKLNELKKRIDSMAINYAALTNKFKGVNQGYSRNNPYQDNGRKFKYYNCEKMGHIARNYQNREGRKETFNQTRNVNFCKVIDNNSNTEKKIYNVRNGPTSQENVKRLRERKIPKVQSPVTNEVSQDKNINQNPKVEGPNIKDRTKRKRNLVEIPISNTGVESLKPYKEEEDYNSESGDTFDEFDYEKKEEVDEVEDRFIEEYQEENPALFLTNVIEVPIEEHEEENSVESKIQQTIKNNDLTPQQSQEVKEFLLSKRKLFAQGLEDLGCTDIITHTINTGDTAPIHQGPYKVAHGERVALPVRRMLHENETFEKYKGKRIRLGVLPRLCRTPFSCLVDDLLARCGKTNTEHLLAALWPLTTTR
ncbi:38825_t:CDS:2, partial [Gigaspora margarita]